MILSLATHSQETFEIIQNVFNDLRIFYIFLYIVFILNMYIIEQYSCKN